MTKEQQSVLKTIEAMTSAFHAGDIEGVMNSYETEATILFEPGSPVTDAEAIKQMFQGAFTLNPLFEYSGHQVIITGDIAVHFAPWKMSGKTPDGQAIEQSGLSVAVLRKQTDGRWLIVIDNPHGQALLDD